MIGLSWHVSLQQATSLLSFTFLAGVVLVFISPLAPLRRRFPRLLMYGFALAVLSIAMVLVAALTLGWAVSD